jgi:nucleolar protein 12
MAGRANKLLGVASAARQTQAKGKGSSKDKSSSTVHAWGDKDGAPMKTPEQIVFEGKRAKPGDAPLFRKKAKKPSGLNRGAKRAAAWKKAKGSVVNGGKK